MTNKNTLQNLSDNFKQNAPLTTVYTIIGLFFASVSFTLVVISTILGHRAIYPFIADTPLVDLHAGELFVVGLIGVFCWAAPYTLVYFLLTVFSPSTSLKGVPKYPVWGIYGLLPATLFIALVWFTPIYSTIFPSVAASLSTIQPTGAENNLVTYAFLVLPMLITHFVFTLDDLREDSRYETYTTTSTESPESTNTSPSSNENTGASTQDTSSEQTNTTNANQDTSTPATDPSGSTNVEGTDKDSSTRFGSYTYDWQEPPLLRFQDVGGLDEVKNELHDELIRPLSGDVQKYKEFGVSIPNLLFYGPPGTGKTYLAQALAGELQYPYVKLSASDVTSKWINESGDNINTLFSEAKQIGDSYGFCVIFIDEIDALLSDRGGTNQHSENKKVVNEFLNHLSETTEQNTLFIGATNVFDDLDSAAIRPGRIDKKIEIGLPETTDARLAILRAQLRSRPGGLPDNGELWRLADELDGATAADIGSLVDDAARYAVQRDGDAITDEDLLQAYHNSSQF